MLSATRSIRVSMLTSFVLSIWTICASTASFGHDDGVNWQPWEKASFDKARNEGKLILINVGMEGCTACSRMERITYQNSAVIEMLNKHFVAIAVDAEARPDIGERYSDWAWPATAFLLPDSTQVFAMAGNRLPRNFIPMLEDLIAKHEQGTLSPDPNSPYASAPEPVTTELTLIRDQVRKQLDRAYNEQNNSWGRYGVNTEVAGPRMMHLFYRAHLYDNDELKAMGMAVAENFRRSLDPVWGGIYQIAIAPGITDIPDRFAKLRAIPEKRLGNQSNALLAFATAYRLSGDENYRKAAKEVDRYLTTWMLSPTQTWYANQKDEPAGMPHDWWPQDYWLLDSDEKRRKYGIPPIDHAIYSDANADLISAYALASVAFQQPNYLAKAAAAAESLLKERQQPTGWLRQSVETQQMQDDQRVHPHTEEVRPFLKTQANFGAALLALYQASGDQRWLDQAYTIADAMLEYLYDKDHAGFFATTPDDTAHLIPPRKPLEDNAVAASFFHDLAVISKVDKYKPIAEATIRAVATPEILNREGKQTGKTALALERLTAAYVEFSVVSPTPTPSAAELYQAGLTAYHPRKLIHYEAPGRYPDMGKAVMFICNPDRCSIPITSTNQVQRIADSFRAGATSQ